jgi:hypothetical protein
MEAPTRQPANPNEGALTSPKQRGSPPPTPTSARAGCRTSFAVVAVVVFVVCALGQSVYSVQSVYGAGGVVCPPAVELTNWAAASTLWILVVNEPSAT